MIMYTFDEWTHFCKYFRLRILCSQFLRPRSVRLSDNQSSFKQNNTLFDNVCDIDIWLDKYDIF